jgi:hypothetical protein
LAAGPRPVGMCLAQPCALGGSQAGQLQPLTSSQPFLDGCRLGTVALVGKGPARAVSCPGSQPWAWDHLPDSAHTLGRHRVGAGLLTTYCAPHSPTSLFPSHLRSGHIHSTSPRAPWVQTVLFNKGTRGDNDLPGTVAATQQAPNKCFPPPEAAYDCCDFVTIAVAIVPTLLLCINSEQ